jgi:hypothetical protein
MSRAVGTRPSSFPSSSSSASSSSRVAKRRGTRPALRFARFQLPKFADWTEARKTDDSLLTEWQIYRMFDARRGAWSTFQFLVRERLREAGVEVAPDGTIS